MVCDMVCEVFVDSCRFERYSPLSVGDFRLVSRNVSAVIPSAQAQQMLTESWLISRKRHHFGSLCLALVERVKKTC